MYSQDVWAAIEIPWNIAIAAMVLSCAIAVIIVVCFVQKAQTRRMAMLCSVVDKVIDRTGDYPTLQTACHVIAEHLAIEAKRSGWSPAALCEAFGKLPEKIQSFVCNALAVMVGVVLVMSFLLAVIIQGSRHESKMKDRGRTATSTYVASHPNALVGMSMTGITLDERGEIIVQRSGGRDSRFGRFSGPAFYSRLSCHGGDFGCPTATFATH